MIDTSNSDRCSVEGRCSVKHSGRFAISLHLDTPIRIKVNVRMDDKYRGKQPFHLIIRQIRYASRNVPHRCMRSRKNFYIIDEIMRLVDIIFSRVQR